MGKAVCSKGVGESFLFTGGTIKLGHYMDEDEATQKEQSKLNRLRDCLKAEGMYDEEAYTELEL